MEAKENMRIMPGALEICRFLDGRGLRRGLITRNVSESVAYFHSRFEAAPFAPALSREFLPYKPDPAPLLHICNAWSVLPTEVLMIGDSVKDDIVCGRRAGASTCHLDSSCQFPAEAADPKRRATPSQEANQEHEPDFRIASLTQLQELLETHFDLPPPLSS
eukprot:SM000159S01768  [mRNA]  locus=s159:160845:162059:+ [translate_table: standard]